MSDLTHFDDQGASHMVDVGQKLASHRSAKASAHIRMLPSTARLIADQRLAKGNVFEVARLAGILAAKRTDELIPLCHTIPLTSVEVSFQFDSDEVLCVTATAATVAQTGVEMEALVAVTVAALTVYDMCKSVDRSMVVQFVRLDEKTGGRSGTFRREEPAEATRVLGAGSGERRSGTLQEEERAE